MHTVSHNNGRTMANNSSNLPLPFRWLPVRLRVQIEKRHELQQAITNIGWLAMRPVVELMVGLSVGIWVARALGPENYGSLNYAIAFVALFSPLATLGVSLTVVRDLVHEPEAAADLLGSATFLRALGSAALFVASSILIALLRPDDTSARLFVAIIAVGYTIRNLGTFEFWFSAKVQGKYTVWSRSISVLFSAAIRATLILIGAGVMMFVVAFSIELAFVVLCMLVFYSATSGLPVSQWRVRVERVRQIFSDSWPLMMAGFMAIIYMKIGQVILGEMRGDADVGIYAVGAHLSETFEFLPKFVFISVFPALIKSRKIDRELYLDRFQRLYDLFVWYGIVSAVLMFFIATPIVSLLYGKQYVDSGPVLAAHIWSGVFWFAGLAGHRYLITENHTRIQLFMTLCGAFTNVAANFLLIPKFGPLGAAYATCASFAVSHLLSGIVFEPSRITLIFFLRALYLPGVVRRWVKLWS